jgi:predicted amidophosphoribosyltransferase
VAYSGPARPLVRAWKEHGLRRAADLAVALVVEHVAPPAADAITYIPPDADRLLRRGAHPAEALARGLAGAWGLECRRLLVRSGRAAGQTRLDRRQRLRNVRGAFAACAAAPGRVILVDDVYTTGASTGAAAQALRAAGAIRVDTVTFARTVR